MTVDNDALLTGIQPQGPAKLFAHALGPSNALITSLPDQLALKLRQSAHNIQDKLSLWRRGIAPRIIQGLELASSCLDLILKPKQIADRAGQPIELHCHRSIARH